MGLVRRPIRLLLLLLLGLQSVSVAVAALSGSTRGRGRPQGGTPASARVGNQQPPLRPSLHDLVSGADTQLRQQGPPAPDRAILSVVNRRRREDVSPVAAAPASTLTGWVILGKCSVRDQLTLEQAARVHAAVRLLKTGVERPSVLVFCGGDLADVGWAMSSTAQPELHTAPAALAYGFFRSAAEAQGIDLDGITFVVDQRSTGAHDGITSAAIALQKALGERRQQHGEEAAGAERRELPVLVRLFSTDHHLQRLHDVELLTPRQSTLQPLRALRARIEYTHASYPWRTPSWLVSTHGARHRVLDAFARHDGTTRRARAAVFADELQVVQLNVEGMLDSAEQLLHPDNFQRLRHVRSQLGQDLLSYDAPPGSLANMHVQMDGAVVPALASKWLPSMPSDERCDRASEEAVALLGKVQEALKPVAADPTRVHLPPEELRDLLQLIMGAVRLLRFVDPDRPIKPYEWQRLVEGHDDSVVEMVKESVEHP